jgi:hypothetical protein
LKKSGKRSQQPSRDVQQHEQQGDHERRKN